MQEIRRKRVTAKRTSIALESKVATELLDPEEQFLKNFRNICRFAKGISETGRSVRSSSPEGQLVVAALERFARRISRLIQLPPGFDIQYSRGQSNLPSVLWVAVTRTGALVSNGPSVAVCFSPSGTGAVAGIMDSVTIRSVGFETAARSRNAKGFIDVDGPKVKYNDIFVNPMEIQLKFDAAKPFLEHLRQSISTLVAYYERLKR